MPDAVSTKLEVQRGLILSAYSGDIEGVKRQLQEGADIDDFEPRTGLSALHIAIGRNHVDLVRFLLDKGATVRPDVSGRWPSTIAEWCEVDGKIVDMVVDAESELGIV